jgi:hypothetical protein
MYRSIAALTLVLTSASALSQTVGFDLPGGTTTVADGSTFTLDLQGSGWTNGLVAGGVDLSYNSSVLTLESVTINTNVFDNAGLPIGNCDPANCAAALPAGTTSGNVLVSGIDFATFFNPAATGNFEIASFQFVADKTGSTNLGLSVDCCAAPFVSTGGLVTPEFQAGNVSVTSATVKAPELDPALALSGFILLLGVIAVLRAGIERRFPL